MWNRKITLLVHLQVAVNGAHLLEYKHRIPLDRVDTFSICGKVRVHAIGYIPNSVSTCRSHISGFFPLVSKCAFSPSQAIFSESGDLVSFYL